ncbi:Alpha-1,3-mannosyl-glycoprotein 2-beta-N-acetylglucosaminyltransferase [Caenorhabditis elegans]|uniref:Alpha-1,3-mannosyl-glycoprotein 2-beta-N-acetylglucosaminyltransferase n=1 Tax=Caenorhabditis elegans TaxID=6239 RepID=G5EBG7_CAEEL|nr:Alpha-1,3-mannosyl-glycoprotein 2-beta-N-acetylglucosaminyltransferase [Caenorhabditis elegans]AAD03023.1 UDP-N-acetylglucosamine:a-3-D-mannoside b-1,2-N-acetylglucosaminyltransferase I [Caenorhabditis elegans]CCD71299.1 Alpha-1,3-mannosyl-glycoprotein 2-beta-N-acetylglucosaminyltransferase [Caenorhabditis elegans]|eukprot:NP_741838.1 GLYcosylation related [Caenorhabditis elegans]
MKRVLRRSASKHASTLFKIICILVLCSFIIYLKSEDHDLQKNTAIHAPRSNSREDEDDILIPADNKDQQFVAAVLVFCATRPDALRNHLSQILAQRPSHFQYHIIVSQDGNKTAVTQVAQKFVKDYKNVSHIQHEKTEIKKRNNYPAISAHYKWALDKAFKGFRYDHVIVTEDDLDIGNDFFSYFRWGKQVLNSDDTIWCVSAWNDNGGGPLIDSTRGDLIWRTDFFPGLGWMLTKKLWNELSPGFPVAYWDDWMRKPEVRKSRSCIRPEISRTSHNMKLAGKGSSGGMFKDYLSKISASSANIDFSLLPVTLVQKSIYDKRLIEQIENARPIDLQNTTGMEKTYNYKIVYKNIRDWHRLAAHFKLMTDIRGGMQRTAYYGVVTLMFQNCRVFLVPESTYRNPSQLTSYVYDSEWDKQNRFIEFEAYYCKTKKYAGKCDPHSPEMIAFFKKKGWKKRLDDWGEMLVV